MAARDLVERLGEQGRILRVLGELAVERRRSGELDRQRVAGQALRVRLAEDGRGRDRLLLDSRQDRPLPGLLELLQLERWRRRRLDRLTGDGLRYCLRDCLSDCPLGLAQMAGSLQELEPVRDRFA